MNIGERLKGARLRAGLNLRDLARQAGISAQAVSKYERGLDIPGSSVLISALAGIKSPGGIPDAPGQHYPFPAQFQEAGGAE